MLETSCIILCFLLHDWYRKKILADCEGGTSCVGIQEVLPLNHWKGDPTGGRSQASSTSLWQGQPKLLMSMHTHTWRFDTEEPANHSPIDAKCGGNTKMHWHELPQCLQVFQNSSQCGSPAYRTHFTHILLGTPFHTIHVARVPLLCLDTIIILQTQQTKQCGFPYHNVQ